ncbi:DUF4097 family beta strand repeat-containing protein [Asaia sp. VD9]|uniref:DUF4097 family beta strand repeat-containing protein n=1 Tax=Asaia sp. VD9 TaxID=3081235 RepID=UPI003015D5B8
MSRFSLGIALVLTISPAYAEATAPTNAPSASAPPSSPEAALAAAPYTLHIESGCAARIHIQGAGALLQNADMREIPAGLSFEAGRHDAWLTGSACGEDATIQLRAGAAIVSTALNYDKLEIDWVNGPLSLRQGRGDIAVDKASALLFRGSGPGDLTLGTLSGPAIFAMSGPGDVQIETATASSVVIGTTGPGDVLIRGGTIDQLVVTLSGPGDAVFDGVARNAMLRTSASGDIRVHQVLENEHAHSSASGSIEVAIPSRHGETFSGAVHGSSTNNGTRVTPDDMRLADGTRINSHRMIKPDGTIIDFDALRRMSDEAAHATPPTPPDPPEPPEPPEPHGETAQKVDQHTTAAKPPKVTMSVDMDSGGGTFSGLIVLIVLAVALMRRRIIPKLLPVLRRHNPEFARRVEPFLLSLMTKVTAPMPQTQLPQLLDLTQRLQKLDKRVGAVETCVTSRDFHLHTQFRDLNRSRG